MTTRLTAEFIEISKQAVDPSAAPTDTIRLYLGADDTAKYIDDAGNVVTIAVNSIRYDVPQALTPDQRIQARQNILADQLGAAATVQDSLDTHEGEIASGAALGHVRVGTGLSVDGDGVLSADGGGGGMPLIVDPVTGDFVTQAADGTLVKAGVSASSFLLRDAEIVAVSSARNLQASDAGKILEANGTFTLTAPDGLATGFQCAIVNVGTGTITLAAATTLQGKGTLLAEQYGAATIYHRGSNVWLAFGDLS